MSDKRSAKQTGSSKRTALRDVLLVEKRVANSAGITGSESEPIALDTTRVIVGGFVVTVTLRGQLLSIYLGNESSSITSHI